MDIPDDVLKVAVKTAYELHHTIEPHTEVIARVILAERERCADIVQETTAAWRLPNAGLQLASAIRTPPTGEEQ